MEPSSSTCENLSTLGDDETSHCSSSTTAAGVDSEGNSSGSKSSSSSTTSMDRFHNHDDGNAGNKGGGGWTKAELPDDIRPLDVVFGRGAPIRNHPGNIRMRRIIQSRKQQYQTMKHRPLKRLIIRQVIDQIKQPNSSPVAAAATLPSMPSLTNRPDAQGSVDEEKDTLLGGPSVSSSALASTTLSSSTPHRFFWRCKTETGILEWQETPAKNVYGKIAHGLRGLPPKRHHHRQKQATKATGGKDASISTVATAQAGAGAAVHPIAENQGEDEKPFWEAKLPPPSHPDTGFDHQPRWPIEPGRQQVASLLPLPQSFSATSLAGPSRFQSSEGLIDGGTPLRTNTGGRPHMPQQPYGQGGGGQESSLPSTRIQDPGLQPLLFPSAPPLERLEMVFPNNNDNIFLRREGGGQIDRQSNPPSMPTAVGAPQGRQQHRPSQPYQYNMSPPLLWNPSEQQQQPTRTITSPTPLRETPPQGMLQWLPSPPEPPPMRLLSPPSLHHPLLGMPHWSSAPSLSSFSSNPSHPPILSSRPVAPPHPSTAPQDLEETNQDEIFGSTLLLHNRSSSSSSSLPGTFEVPIPNTFNNNNTNHNDRKDHQADDEDEEEDEEELLSLGSRINQHQGFSATTADPGGTPPSPSLFHDDDDDR